MHERQAAAVAWLRRKCIAGSYRGAAHRAPAIGCTGCQWAAPAIEAHRPTDHGHWLPASRTRRLERSLRSVWASGATGYRKRPTGQAAAHRLPASNRLHRPSKGCAPATAASIEAHRPTEGLRTAPAASIEGGCTATVGVQSNANRGAAPHRPRLPVAAPAMHTRYCQHRSAPANRGAAPRTGHRLHRLPASKAAARPRLASNRTRTANRGAAHRNRPRLHRPSKRTGQPATATGRQHRRRLHGHGWRPIERERPTEGLRTATGHGCQWLHRPCTLGTASIEAHRPTEGLHRAPAIGCQHRSAPANRGAAPANRPRPLAASIAHKASRTLSEKRLG